MKSEIDSRTVPGPKKETKKKIAYNKRVPVIEEIRYRIADLVSESSPFKLNVRKSKSNISVRFTNRKFSNSCKFSTSDKKVEVFNPAFGKNIYKQIDIMAVSLGYGTDQCREFIDAIYWGTVDDSEDVKSFVRNNARIIRRRIPLRLKDGTSSTLRKYVCTDVNAYTRNIVPNPWSRGYTMPLYENTDIINELQMHPKLGVNISEFGKTLSSDIVDSSDL